MSHAASAAPMPAAVRSPAAVRTPTAAPTRRVMGDGMSSGRVVMNKWTGGGRGVMDKITGGGNVVMNVPMDVPSPAALERSAVEIAHRPGGTDRDHVRRLFEPHGAPLEAR